MTVQLDSENIILNTSENRNKKNYTSLETEKNFGSDYFEPPTSFKKRVVEKKSRPSATEVEDIIDFLE